MRQRAWREEKTAAACVSSTTSVSAATPVPSSPLKDALDTYTENRDP